MLMGIPAGSMGISDSYVEQDKYFGDLLRRRLEGLPEADLNLGLRYEYESPMTERFDRSAIHFAGSTPNPLNDAARANYAKNPIPELPGRQLPGHGRPHLRQRGPQRPHLLDAEKTNFQPRIGFAYQLNPKTIMRGGYGIFTASIGVNYTNTNQTGFSLSTPIQATQDNGLTYIATNANPLPNGLLQPARSSAGLLTNIGQGISFFADNRKHPYSQRWSFGVQQRLPLASS